MFYQISQGWALRNDEDPRKQIFNVLNLNFISIKKHELENPMGPPSGVSKAHRRPHFSLSPPLTPYFKMPPDDSRTDPASTEQMSKQQVNNH